MSQKQRRFVAKRRWLYPVGLEREYQRFAKRLVKALLEAGKEELASLQRLATYSTIKTDGVSADIITIMQAVRKRFGSKISDMQMEAEIRRLAKLTDDYNSKQFQAAIRSALQVDIFQHEPWLQELTNMWVAENVRLIKSIPEQFFGDVEGIVNRGLMDGSLGSEMGDDIKRVYEVTDRRSQLIARDQVGKLNGDLTKYRQTGVGIESYVWSTSKDSRVRPQHSAREGKEYKWIGPPPGGHPGKAIYCRCVALPVIDLDKIQYVGMPGRR